jgi:hypothetical protein
MGIRHYLIVDPRDGSCTYYHGIGSEQGRPACDNRFRHAYGDTVTVLDWKINTEGLPRSSEKDMRS